MNKTIVLSAAMIAAALLISAIIVTIGMRRLGEDLKTAASRANPANGTFVVKLANWDEGLKLKPVEVANWGQGSLRVEETKK